jgi:SAM-dependent methyltransferase
MTEQVVSPMSAILERAPTLRICGKSPVGAFLRANEWAWKHIPVSLIGRWPVRSSGHFLHSLVRRWATRRHYTGTFFLRNRPQLELIRRLLSRQRDEASPLAIAVLGCSNGAEVYSILATLRSARLGQTIVMHAVDISPEVLEVAQQGVYSASSSQLVGAPIFERMTTAEIEAMFDRDGETLSVKPWIRTGIDWRLADATAPETLALIGLQDLVVANNFLCHMSADDAERCLRGLARLVKPEGYLVVSGVDVDVRTRVARDLGWQPVEELLEETHDGDSAVRNDWPAQYWGLEPLDHTRHDWRLRYAAVFQLPSRAADASSPTERCPAA